MFDIIIFNTCSENSKLSFSLSLELRSTAVGCSTLEGDGQFDYSLTLICNFRVSPVPKSLIHLIETLNNVLTCTIVYHISSPFPRRKITF